MILTPGSDDDTTTQEQPVITVFIPVTTTPEPSTTHVQHSGGTQDQGKSLKTNENHNNKQTKKSYKEHNQMEE